MTRPNSAVRRALVTLAALALAAGAVVAAGGSALAAGSGRIYVVHGLPGTTADVVLDGRQVATGVRPATIVGPVDLAAGSHVVTIRTAGRSLTSARFTVRAGQSLDLVAQRSADATGAARVVVFRNDLDPVGPGKGRLVVGHAMSAPPVDVRIDGRTLFHDVASGEALSLVVPARTYAFEARASGSGAPVLGPDRVSVRAGTLTRVFAVGDAADGPQAVVQVLPVPVVGAGRPRSVPTGDGGQAAESYVDEGPNLRPLGVLAAGAALLLLLRRAQSLRRVAARMGRAVSDRSRG